jgi:hypothetical protein
MKKDVEQNISYECLILENRVLVSLEDLDNMAEFDLKELLFDWIKVISEDDELDFEPLLILLKDCANKIDSELEMQ